MDFELSNTAALVTSGIRDHDTLALPFGTGRTSPIAANDVANVVTAVLLAPQRHIGSVYELTGPAALHIDELAHEYSGALGRPITAAHLSYDDWFDQLAGTDLNPHVQQHIATMAKLHRDDRYNRSNVHAQQPQMPEVSRPRCVRTIGRFNEPICPIWTLMTSGVGPLLPTRGAVSGVSGELRIRADRNAGP